MILAFDVDADGRVVDIQAMDAIGNTRIQKSFEKAAISALQQWRFTPATIDGQPVRQSNMLQKFIFALHDSNGGVYSDVFAKFMAVQRRPWTTVTSAKPQNE